MNEEEEEEEDVTEQVLVPFLIERYEDVVLCDVSMNSSHLLFRRSWQFDKRATHNGYTKRYSFMYEGKMITLVPLSPSQAKDDRVSLNKNIEAWNESKKIEKVNRKERFEEKQIHGVEKEKIVDEKEVEVENGKVEKDECREEKECEEHILPNPYFSLIPSFVLHEIPTYVSFQFNDSSNMLLEETIDVTFCDPKVTTLVIPKVMSFKVPRDVYIDVPSALPILKKFSNQCDTILFKHNTFTKLPSSSKKMEEEGAFTNLTHLSNYFD
ncbi:hypothetical protein GQ457_04G019990 [Hibiscus cannabinus]